MNINEFIVTGDTYLLDVMKKININGRGIAFVCNQEILKAVVTDGDIRRYILENNDLNVTINKLANYNPIYIKLNEYIDSSVIMKRQSINSIPIVDEQKKIISIEFLDKSKIYKNTSLDSPVVIMAGGKGTRLSPYTNVLPKPLIPIGDETITELIMNNFEAFGCNKFSMIVNYKKNLIKSFFKDNDKKRDIQFFDEINYMGTGGGLKTLSEHIKTTFFMTNCDILIDEDYSDILDFHKRNKNIITIVSAMKNVTIPYGTINIDSNGYTSGLKEKPTFSFMANTGLYVIEPEFLEFIPENTFIHITDIIQLCIEKGKSVGAYPISEYAWMDMGQLEELENMKRRIEKSI